MRIYFDTEFSSLWDPQLISVGMVAQNGESLYVEVKGDAARDSTFTRDVVRPLMHARPIAEEEARAAVRDFLAPFMGIKPELVCDFIGDYWLLRALVPNLPEYGTPRCSLNGPPDDAWEILKLRRHHALDDAKALMAVNPDLQPCTD